MTHSQQQSNDQSEAPGTTRPTRLSTCRRWLLLSLLLNLALIGVVVWQQASEPTMVPITGMVGDPSDVVARLEHHGIMVHTDGAQVLVPPDQHTNALVVVALGQLQDAFEELAKVRAPWLSSELHRQNVLSARQRALAAIISKMNGVKQADVMISSPQQPGFGETHVRTSTSVNVVMDPRHRVTKPLVVAITGLVTGAYAAMAPQDVVVIDANRGRQFTVKG